MRILTVRFKNLNSLSGEWYLDFTRPAFINSGIFAITGPTGAGKTTILDAICLALYGRTPRLNRVNKSGNEIMSRQTGECFAETTFQTAEGRFRCHWSQHRARNKPDGELQNPRHEIAEADSGKVLENKLRDVVQKVEQVCGMDFDRFTRSMLLAQGGFAAFLQAAPDERAPILEQITGTDIYSRISIKVHEQQADNNRQLKELENVLGGMRILSGEEVNALRTELDSRLQEESEVTRQVSALQRSRTSLEGIAGLKKEIASLKIKYEDFNKKQEEFQPRAERLERANQALALEGPVVKLLNLRDQQKQDSESRTRAGEKLETLQQTLASALAARQLAQTRWEEARAAQDDEAQIIKAVREIDFKIKEKKNRLKICDQALQQIQKQRLELEQRVVDNDQTLQRSRAALSEVQNYLTQNRLDADLVTNLAAIGKMFEALAAVHDRYVDTGQAQLAASQSEISAADACSLHQSRQEKLQADLTRAQERHQLIIGEIDNLLGERELGDWHHELAALKDRQNLLQQTVSSLEQIDLTQQTRDELLAGRQTLIAEKERLGKDIEAGQDQVSQWEREAGHLGTQLELLKRIRSLEEERAYLEEGKPCPLCGATEHPYAGGAPVMDQTELDYIKAQAQLKEANRQLSALKISQAGTDKDLEQIGSDIAAKSTALTDWQNECRDNFDKLQMTASNQPLSQIQDELTRVKARIKSSSDLIARVEARSKEAKSSQNDLEKTRNAFAASEQAWQQARYERELAQREHQRLIQEYAALKEQVQSNRQEILKAIAAYGIDELPISELDTILRRLTLRRDTWLEKQSEQNRHQENIAALVNDLGKNQILLDKLNGELKQQQKVYEELARQHNELVGRRSDLYADKNPDEEGKNCTRAVENAAQALDQARTFYTGTEQECSHVQSQIKSLEQTMEERKAVLQQAERQMLDRLTAAGFQDEADYREACLTESVRKELAKKVQLLREEKTRLETLLHDKTTLLAVEESKKMTDQAYDEVQEQLTAREAALKECQRQIGGLTQTLQENELIQTRQKELLEKIRIQKEETLRWNNLHELIGSADGKKYRNFAQGLTFEIMINHANRQLQKLSDRYLLIRDDRQPLELNVIDNYQTGKIRSTRNLSGGESFIVSLALALGLSNMASRQVRVDSLFLDEGFGTLDEDALEMALDTLAELQQEGKLIGVISHIAAVKERITTQIQVIPQSGGHSIIVG